MRNGKEQIHANTNGFGDSFLYHVKFVFCLVIPNMKVIFWVIKKEMQFLNHIKGDNSVINSFCQTIKR